MGALDSLLCRASRIWSDPFTQPNSLSDQICFGLATVLAWGQSDLSWHHLAIQFWLLIFLGCSGCCGWECVRGLSVAYLVEIMG